MEKNIRSVVVLIIILFSSFSFAHLNKQPPGVEKSNFIQPRQIVEIFLKAVAKGELVIFDREIDQSMLIPVRVEYVYELDSEIPAIKVYSELKEPMRIPGLEHCSVKGVSAVLDGAGAIIMIETLIRPE